jgi:hypothetical protein
VYLSDFRQAFAEDVEDTYLDLEEFAEMREFGTRGQSGTYNVRSLKVIWNHDTLKNLSPVMAMGQLMIGDVLLLTRIKDWPVRPRRGAILYSPRDTAWTVMVCVSIMHSLYRISLQEVVST